MRVEFLLILLILFGCSAINSEEKKKAIEGLYLNIEEINNDVKIMESLYDSSLNALARKESWDSISNLYSDSVFGLFNSLNDNITSINDRAAKAELDSAEYEVLFSKLNLEMLQVKLEKLKSEGYQYDF